jgi:ketosteroid isomerase-like protein
MNRADAVDLMNELHIAQNTYYSGGPDGDVRRLLTDDVVWTVPGTNAIAGTYVGVESVVAYFELRRLRTNLTFQMHQRDVLVGEGGSIAALSDGTAVIHGEECTWSTVGLYEVTGHQILRCHLLPLDPAVFDRIWS